MVAQNNKADKKYNEQLDTSLPVYVITCLDNLLSPIDTIDISLHHFRNDRGAKAFSKALAKSKGWHSWEVNCDDREVYFVNKNTGEQRG